MESKTGIKTIDKLSELPVVNTALTNVTDYYSKVKDKNALLRTSFNLAELSFKTMVFATTPIANLCKKPIESFDTYLSDKVDNIEQSYPIITKPTDQLTSSVKDMYDKNLKQPIEAFTNIKDKTVSVGAKVVDACLENRFAKMLTNPVLDFTENTLDYFLPVYDVNNKTGIDSNESSTTLKRIYNLNTRVYKQIYDATFNQLTKLHLQFENTIQKLVLLKKFCDQVYVDTKQKLSTSLSYVTESTLVSKCANFIDKHELSLEKLEALSKTYYKAILSDFIQNLEKYMNLVKNFPVVFNGTKVRQTLENFKSQMNKESFLIYMSFTIDYLKSINESLVSYTNQMFQVVSNSKYIQGLKRPHSQENLKANQNESTSTSIKQMQTPIENINHSSSSANNLVDKETHTSILATSMVDAATTTSITTTPPQPLKQLLNIYPLNNNPNESIVDQNNYSESEDLNKYQNANENEINETGLEDEYKENEEEQDQEDEQEEQDE